MTDPMTRIRQVVDVYREAPFRSANWLAAQVMQILDTEPANDARPDYVAAIEDREVFFSAHTIDRDPRSLTNDEALVVTAYDAAIHGLKSVLGRGNPPSSSSKTSGDDVGGGR